MTVDLAARTRDGWGLHEGEAITAELTAMRLLGGGAAYEAYLAFDEVTYGPVVVKLVRPAQVLEEATLRGLRREAESLQRANHPAVVRLLRHVPDGERPHLVLEHLDGPRLSSLVRRHGPLPEQQYLPLAVELASALHYLHRIDLVHLDVKPSNVIMGAPARLIDLSLARSGERAAALSSPIGTDAFMAPEQADPLGPISPGPASDVWGLGVTLFYAIAGYLPFDDGDFEAPYALPRTIAGDVAEALLATLAPRPEDRPRPHELSEALSAALARAPRGKLSYKVR